MILFVFFLLLLLLLLLFFSLFFSFFFFSFFFFSFFFFSFFLYLFLIIFASLFILLYFILISSLLTLIKSFNSFLTEVNELNISRFVAFFSLENTFMNLLNSLTAFKLSAVFKSSSSSWCKIRYWIISIINIMYLNMILSFLS